MSRWLRRAGTNATTYPTTTNTTIAVPIARLPAVQRWSEGRGAPIAAAHEKGSGNHGHLPVLHVPTVPIRIRQATELRPVASPTSRRGRYDRRPDKARADRVAAADRARPIDDPPALNIGKRRSSP